MREDTLLGQAFYMKKKQGSQQLIRNKSTVIAVAQQSKDSGVILC